MTQFKEKAGVNKENASVGLLVYPNLMAADILIYKATHVPVGEDQKQHLELTRDIAKKFNNDFKCVDYFPIVEPLIPKEISRVMSLRDGKKKMSKSDSSDHSRINLKDDKDLIDQKIKKAKTDSAPIPLEVSELKKRHEAENLISIYASVNEIKVEEVLNEFGGKNFSTFKSKLSESIIERICPIGNEIKKLLKDKNYLNSILKKGAKRADIIAKNNLKEIYDIVGLNKFTWLLKFVIIKASMMVQTEHTPNPDTLKFLPGKKVSEIGPVEFLKNDKNINVHLANKILSLEGTSMVFFG